MLILVLLGLLAPDKTGLKKGASKIRYMQNQIFHFNNQKVRIEQINNEPYFCASDVCKILDISNGADILKKRIEIEYIEKIYIPHPQSKTKQIEMSFVNEAGLYDLIFCSNKAEAKEFKKWVFKEVLPSIRKTGSYNNIKTLSHQEQILLFAKEIVNLSEKNKELKNDNEKKQNTIEEFLVVGNNTNYTNTAKNLKLQPKAFISYLKGKYISQDRIPYQRYIDCGYFTIKIANKGYQSYLITPKGFKYFFNKRELI